MTVGKKFERDFKASVTDSQFFLRLHDAMFFGKTEAKRFSLPTLCDCVLYTHGYLYLLELKTHKGRSIPAAALRQVDDLAAINRIGVYPAFVLNFRDHSETYIIDAAYVKRRLETKKSISIDFCKTVSLRIPQKKLRVNWRFDLSVL